MVDFFTILTAVACGFLTGICCDKYMKKAKEKDLEKAREGKNASAGGSHEKKRKNNHRP